MHELYWELPVIIYLFLGGMGAGAGAVSASIFLRSKGGDLASSEFRFARWGALIAPVLVIAGTGMIVFETGSFQVGNYLRFINLFTQINLSPMSVGSWMLLLFILVSLGFAYTFLRKDTRPGDALHGLRKKLAWVMVPLGLGVAIYTGVLLGAMPSRPFWNSPILAMLFTASALSTGVAAIILSRALLGHEGIINKSAFEENSYMLSSSDSLLIAVEIFIVFLFVMYAYLTIGNVEAAVAVIMGGGYTVLFWAGFVLVGLVVPCLIELRYVLPKMVYQEPFIMTRKMEILCSVLVLIGGFLLRYIVVIAGQVTGPVGI